MSNLVPLSNQSIVSNGIQVNSMDDLSRLAKMMSDSGFFSDCKQAAQAGVKIMCGIELGFPAFSSLVGIHIIQGKPAIGANLMAAAIKRSGRYNYRVIEHTDTVCKIAFFERNEQVGVSEFTADEARKCGTQNMNKFPKNMLFARAMSNGVKWYCPDIFLGAPVYTPEELGATVDGEGNVIEVQSVVEPPQAIAPHQQQQPTESFHPSKKLTTPAQQKRFYAIAKGAGYSDAAAKMMIEAHGFFSTKEITMDKYDRLCEEAENPERMTHWNQQAERMQAIDTTVQEVTA